MVAAAASFALMAAFAKKLLPETPIQAIVLSRALLMTTLFAFLARRRGVSVRGNRKGLLLARGLLGYGALSCYFFAVQHLPLGDAVLLQFSHPIFVTLLAPLLLKEKGSSTQWALTLLALAGVAMIVQPTGEFRPGAWVGLLGSLLAGLAYLAVRDLARTEHPLAILFWFPAASIPPALVATLMAGQAAIPRDLGEVMGHLLVAAAALAGQITLTLGLARSGAARASTVSLTGPVFGLLLGFLMFDTVPTIASALGTALVLISIGLLGRSRAERAARQASDRKG